MNNYMVPALAFSMLIGAAVAQTASPQTGNGTGRAGSGMESAAPNTTAPRSPTTDTRSNLVQGAEGMKMGDTATVALKFVTIQPASMMSSKLIGANVYNKQNESLGEIEDMAIENGNRIAAVIVSVGGFLGIGEKYVAIDPSTIVVSQKDGNWRAYVDTSKDNLKNAPKFEYPKART
jgi:hypothetical protein